MYGIGLSSASPPTVHIYMSVACEAKLIKYVSKCSRLRKMTLSLPANYLRNCLSGWRKAPSDHIASSSVSAVSERFQEYRDGKISAYKLVYEL
jgi:hypothetical protein